MTEDVSTDALGFFSNAPPAVKFFLDDGTSGPFEGAVRSVLDVGNCASNKMNAYAVTSNDARCQAVTAAIIGELAAISFAQSPFPSGRWP